MLALRSLRSKSLPMIQEGGSETTITLGSNGVFTGTAGDGVTVNSTQSGAGTTIKGYIQPLLGAR